MDGLGLGEKRRTSLVQVQSSGKLPAWKNPPKRLSDPNQAGKGVNVAEFMSVLPQMKAYKMLKNVHLFFKKRKCFCATLAAFPPQMTQAVGGATSFPSPPLSRSSYRPFYSSSPLRMLRKSQNSINVSCVFLVSERAEYRHGNRKESRVVRSGPEHTESFHCNKNSAGLKRETIIQPVRRGSYMCLWFGCGGGLETVAWKRAQLWLKRPLLAEVGTDPASIWRHSVGIGAN